MKPKLRVNLLALIKFVGSIWVNRLLYSQVVPCGGYTRDKYPYLSVLDVRKNQLAAVSACGNLELTT